MKNRSKSKSEFVRVPTLAERLGVSRGFVYKLIGEGKLPVVRLGQVLLIKRSVAERLLEEGLAEVPR